MIKFVNCRNAKEILQFMEKEPENSNLYVIMDMNLLLSFFNTDGMSTLFSSNSWLFVVESAGESEITFLKSLLDSYTSIQVDSRLYFCVIANQSSVSLLEAYRIPHDSEKELIIKILGTYQNNILTMANDYSFIWERRRNMKGTIFKVLTKDSKPFIERSSNVSKK